MSEIAARITKFDQKEIDTLFKKAELRLKKSGLTILAAPKTLEHGRILIVTPRHSGNSVARNKIRRQLKAIFYQEKLFQAGLDSAIIISKHAMKLNFDELKKMLTSALKK